MEARNSNLTTLVVLALYFVSVVNSGIAEEAPALTLGRKIEYLEFSFKNQPVIVLRGVTSKDNLRLIEIPSLGPDGGSTNFAVGELLVDAVVFSSVDLLGVSIDLENLKRNNSKNCKIPVFWREESTSKIAERGFYIVTYSAELHAFHVDTLLQMQDKNRIEELIRSRATP